MPGDTPADHAAEMAQVRRERDIAIAVAAKAMTEKLDAIVREPVLAAIISERAERERRLLLDVSTETTVPN